MYIINRSKRGKLIPFDRRAFPNDPFQACCPIHTARSAGRWCADLLRRGASGGRGFQFTGFHTCTVFHYGVFTGQGLDRRFTSPRGPCAQLWVALNYPYRNTFRFEYMLEGYRGTWSPGLCCHSSTTRQQSTVLFQELSSIPLAMGLGF